MHGESSFSRFWKIKKFHVSTPKTASADPKITKAPRAWKALALSHSYESHGAKHSPSDSAQGAPSGKTGGSSQLYGMYPFDPMFSGSNEPI